MVWIAAIFSLVFVAGIPTFDENFLYNYGTPVQCVWETPVYYSVTDRAELSITSLFMVWGFYATARDLYSDDLDPFLEALAHWFALKSPILHLISPPLWYLKANKKLKLSRPCWYGFWWFVDKLAFVNFLVWFSLSQILKSSILDLWRIMSGLVWATNSIVSLRENVSQLTMHGDENVWGFGQILPMLLLALPVAQLWEMIQEARANRKDRESSSHSSPNSSTPRRTVSIEQKAKNESATARSPAANDNIVFIPDSVHRPETSKVNIREHYRPENNNQLVERSIASATSVQAPLLADTLEIPGSGEERGGLEPATVKSSAELATESMQNPESVSAAGRGTREPRAEDEGSSIEMQRIGADNRLEQGLFGVSQAPGLQSTLSKQDDDRYQLEKDLYDTKWFQFWMLFWTLAFFGLTIYASQQGLIV